MEAIGWSLGAHAGNPLGVLKARGLAPRSLPANLVSYSRPSRPPPSGGKDSYLVDSASSHMLVSKIKPCMSKYKHLYRETANGSLNQLSFI